MKSLEVKTLEYFGGKSVVFSNVAFAGGPENATVTLSFVTDKEFTEIKDKLDEFKDLREERQGYLEKISGSIVLTFTEVGGAVKVNDGEEKSLPEMAEEELGLTHALVSAAKETLEHNDHATGADNLGAVLALLDQLLQSAQMRSMMEMLGNGSGGDINDILAKLGN